MNVDQNTKRINKFRGENTEVFVRAERPQSSVAACQFSSKGELISANPAFYQLTGISELKPDDSFIKSYVHPLDYPTLNRKFLLAASTGKTYEAHVRMLRNARNEYQTLHLKMHGSGKVVDVEAAPDAPATENVFQHIDQLGVPAILYDNKFNLLKINSDLSRLLNFSDKEINEVNPLTLLEPESLPHFSRAMRQVIRGERNNFSLELGLQDSRGETCWVQFTATKLRGSQGYILAVIQDVSALKRQQLTAQRESQDMRSLIDKVGQDLRDPIRSLLALHHIIELEFSDNTQVMEYFNHYHNSLSQLSKVVEDLLTLNELTRKSKPAAPVNFKVVVQKCLQNLSVLEGFYKIDFDIQVEIKEPILIEERLVTAAIHNLLENAILYSSTHDTPKIRVGIWRRTDQLTIEIADNGSGIPENLQDQIFNMFVRGTSQSPGAGLGLFIVKSAIDKLNGTIRLRSKARQGTWFKIHIPLPA
jgi:PAS domain S-box-containing protein